uniref:GLOBIN domain-containing protein n=1 Tax=Steinernema glaseri TaxID=37863 RepID=A0A1I7ZSK9_9BILA
MEPWYDFTLADKQLIRKSWKILGEDMEGFGIRIYSMIFNQCPEARLLFPFMKFTSDGKEKKTTEFSFQALRFVQVLESAIVALDNLQSLDVILDNLGRRHGKLESATGFHAYFWVTFIECTIFQARSALERNRKEWDKKSIDDVVYLWRQLLRGVINRVELGYNTDIANRSHSMAVNGNGRKASVATKSMSIQQDQNGVDHCEDKHSGVISAIRSLSPFKSKKHSSGSQ